MKEILCIVCPNGCRLSVEQGTDGFVVSGNQCKQGIDFAKTEITNPVRTLATTVRTSLAGVPVLPVRTSGEIPKAKIRDIMNCINTICINRPLGIGETVMENILGLGVDIIATSNILMEEV